MAANCLEEHRADVPDVRSLLDSYGESDRIELAASEH